MAKFTINVAMDVRAYGYVEIEADDLDAAIAKADASFVADNFEPHNNGDDDFSWGYPSGITLTEWDCEHDNGDEEFGDVMINVPDGPWMMTANEGET